MSLEIKCGDNVLLCKELADDSVDICVTSPPYDNLRTYKGHTWDFESLAKELFRVIKPGGVVCWNVNDGTEKDGSETLTSCKQKIFFREKCGFKIHDTMIWQKNNFSNPSHNRYHQVFEYVFILVKGDQKCFNPLKDRVNAQAGIMGSLGKNTYQKRDGERETRSRYVVEQFGMRHNVWKGLTASQENMGQSLPHPAMMPRWLARDLILSWSNTGDLVLDPFLGSGTTALEAISNGRNAIGFDASEEYCAIARDRCNVTPAFQI